MVYNKLLEFSNLSLCPRKNLLIKYDVLVNIDSHLFVKNFQLRY